MVVVGGGNEADANTAQEYYHADWASVLVVADIAGVDASSTAWTIVMNNPSKDCRSCCC
jgi:hypothetical protein